MAYSEKYVQFNTKLKDLGYSEYHSPKLRYLVFIVWYFFKTNEVQKSSL